MISSSTDFITINISNSKTDSISFEKKFPKSLTVAELKCKLEIITGGNAGSMQLEIYNGDKLVAKIDDDSALVGSYPIDPGTRLHVIDNFSLLALDAVEKFDLTDDQYENKADTVRDFLRKNRLGKYNDEEMKELEEKKKRLAEEELQKLQLCTVGARCQVKVEGHPTKRGEIMYNGPIEGKKGIFIGVKYDLPLGKNNGTLDGRQYFKCQPSYGGFVKPGAVEVGDFPIECDDLDDEI